LITESDLNMVCRASRTA